MSERDLALLPEHVSEKLSDEARIPLLEEQLNIDKRVVETGTVRLHIHTEERSETVEVPLNHVQWHVDHVPINQVVAEQPRIRQEGETTIYPIVEERIRIIRDLVLVEELRVTRHAVTTVETSSHRVRREEIVEERIPAVARSL